jgi:hypothetical protein
MSWLNFSANVPNDFLQFTHFVQQQIVHAGNVSNACCEIVEFLVGSRRVKLPPSPRGYGGTGRRAPGPANGKSGRPERERDALKSDFPFCHKL